MAGGGACCGRVCTCMSNHVTTPITIRHTALRLLQLYDLNVELTQTANLLNGCAAEGCVDAQDTRVCPGNSTCVGDLNGAAPSCVCHLGYRGDECDEEGE